MESRQALETVEIEPMAPADATVLLMHGLGADGHDFEPVAREIGLDRAPAVRWVFPHAPVRPVTINQGQRMRAWYDVASLDGRAEDEVGIAQSARAIHCLIERERARGIASERIVVAGFSQGGALALHAALRQPSRLAGVAALSCYLPLASRLVGEGHPANAAVPIFMAHGSFDPLLPYVLGQRSCELLRSRGYDVDWHGYPMAHSVCAEEVAALRDWLLRVLPPRS